MHVLLTCLTCYFDQLDSVEVQKLPSKQDIMIKEQKEKREKRKKQQEKQRRKREKLKEKKEKLVSAELLVDPQQKYVQSHQALFH